MGEAVYAIDDFPDDDLLWRIEWIGGVGYNTSVPSDPLMDVCMAQLPAGETNPLSARSCSWMPVEDPGDLLHVGTRSLGLVHFEERFKD